MVLGDGPLIVQSDKTVLLEVDHPRAQEARIALAPFAELERAPEHVHTYRITPLALWNSRAAGHDAEQVVHALETYSRFPVPQALLIDVAETMSRYGRVRLHKHPAHGLILESEEPAILAELLRHKKIKPMLGARIDDESIIVHPSERGRLKQELLKVGWPAEDLAGYVDGEAHPVALSTEHEQWELRDYQRMAADSFWEGGSGVVVLPCGAGKTMVGAAAMAKAQATTLILVTNTVAGRQWRDELLRRTTLTPEEIGEYSGEKKEIRPITIATYQVVTRKTKGEYRALELFDSRDWGLIIYDEVHLLPAPRLPTHLRSPITSPPRTYRNTRPRRWTRRRCILTHRPQALRRPVERPRNPRFYRHRRMHRSAHHHDRIGTHGLRHGRKSRPLPPCSLRGQQTACRR